MGIKENNCGEHWELYMSDESLNSPETNTALYVGQLKFQLKKSKMSAVMRLAQERKKNNLAGERINSQFLER